MTQTLAHRSYRWLFLSLAVIGFSADQASKYGVFAWLYDRDRLEGSIEVIPGAFEIVAKYKTDSEPYVNKGALWGTTLKLADSTANFFFGVVSVLAAVGIIFWSMRPAATRDGYLCCALGLILGGTLGNLFDRIVFSGVRDFLWWHKFVDWPVFNLADCCLVCGAAMLLLEALFTSTEKNTSSFSQEPAAAADRVSV